MNKWLKWGILISAYILFQAFFINHYIEYGITYGKSDVKNYIGLFENPDIIHYVFCTIISDLARLSGVNEFIILTFLTPLTAFIIFPLILSRLFKDPTVLLTVFGSYFILIGITVSLYAQWYATVIYYLSLVILKNKSLSLLGYFFRVLSYVIHPYILVYDGFKFLFKIFKYDNITILYTLIYFILPNYGFLSDHASEPLIFFRLFTVIIPFIIPLLLLYSNKRTWYIFALLSQNMRLALIDIPYMIDDVITHIRQYSNIMLIFMVIIYFMGVLGIEMKEIENQYNNPYNFFYTGLGKEKHRFILDECMNFCILEQTNKHR